jgi:hypothetical protein
VQQRLFASSSSARAASSLWAHLDVAPLDSNHATNAAFEAVRPLSFSSHRARTLQCVRLALTLATHARARTQDQSPLKVNLGRGVYKDDNGKNWVLPSVRMAEEKIFNEKAGHDYLPFKGWDVFCKRTSEFAFGETNPLLKDKRVATVQAISGTGACNLTTSRTRTHTHTHARTRTRQHTVLQELIHSLAVRFVRESIQRAAGALRVGAEFLSRFLPPTHKGVSVYVADPTYVNHLPIFKLNGFEIKRYRYYDPNTNGLDFKGFVEDLKVLDAHQHRPSHAIRRLLTHCLMTLPERAGGLGYLAARMCAQPDGRGPFIRAVEGRLRCLQGEATRRLLRLRLPGTARHTHTWHPHSSRSYCLALWRVPPTPQGFASGDIDRDGAAFRYFAQEGHQVRTPTRVALC